MIRMSVRTLWSSLLALGLAAALGGCSNPEEGSIKIEGDRDSIRQQMINPGANPGGQAEAPTKNLKTATPGGKSVPQ